MYTKQYRIRDFHILTDASGKFKPIDAICQFSYNGYQISISTSGQSQGACQTPICIYGGNDFQDVVKDGFHTVQDAIDYINNLSK